MKTRRPRRTPFLQSRAGFQAFLWLIIAASIAGFAYYAPEAGRLAEHFVPDDVHPIDYYAEACLAVAMLAGMTLFLSRIPGTAPRYRKVKTAMSTFVARPDLRASRRVSVAKRVHKPRPTTHRRPHPGYNKFK